MLNFFDKIPLVASHGIFWLIILLYHIIVANLNYFSGGYQEVFEVFLFKTILQMLLAYKVLWLFTHYFNSKKWLLFLSITIVLLFCTYTLYHLFRLYYLEPIYPKSYTGFFQNNPNITLSKRVFNLRDFISRSVFFLQPTFLLLIHKFYVNQQKLLKINEQKKINELAVLKNQLNPHFLFNTLNNLYSLTITKSKKAPEIIAKLSEILDYVLYKTNDSFVSINSEITLIENYLLLEKVRYGDRVSISFEKEQIKDVKIAPLILLTFIENAFKHGVSQELHTAKVAVVIKTDKDVINFYIKNTKANNSSDNNSGIGIKNVEKQLELLYKNKYNLNIEDTANTFVVHLNLEAK